MRTITTDRVSHNGLDLSIETGRISTQSNGSVVVSYGETVVFVSACATKKPKEGIDFFPLTVDYLERTYAAGKIPGGFFKREGKPSEQETLNSRIVDRAIRPLFPDGFANDTQVVAYVVSLGSEGNSDSLALIGASAALTISNVPFNGPVAGVRVVRVDGKFYANPPQSELAKADINLFVAGSRTAICMVEGGADEASEEEMLEAVLFGHKSLQPFLDLQERLRATCGQEKMELILPFHDADLARRLRETYGAAFKAALTSGDKHERITAKDTLYNRMKTENVEGLSDQQKALIPGIFHDMERETLRQMAIKDKKRIDGRDFETIRPITCEIDIFPRIHGVSLFTRGETQALVSVTLGTSDDEQTIDSIVGEYSKRFMLHYNFPGFSVGEVKPLRTPGRREVGHGNLAERALSYVVPSKEKFPYTVRIVSDIMESNGSSSMASVCGGTLAMMAAGVPIMAPVAGIAMGLIKEGNDVVVISDILGDEDHVGDMDFKVAGTGSGITALQMDIKIDGVDGEILRTALAQAARGRQHILGKMMECISEPRAEISKYAPQIITIQIKPEKIRDVIGSGGKVIRGIIEATKVKIDVEDSGKITIASPNGEASQRAIAMIREITTEAEVGRVYQGKVMRVVDFGAFVEIIPGVEGLVHISQLSNARVRAVRDLLNEGDEIPVKVIDIDRFGKIKLSRREALPPDHVDNLPPA